VHASHNLAAQPFIAPQLSGNKEKKCSDENWYRDYNKNKKAAIVLEGAASLWFCYRRGTAAHGTTIGERWLRAI